MDKPNGTKSENESEKWGFDDYPVTIAAALFLAPKNIFQKQVQFLKLLPYIQV